MKHDISKLNQRFLSKDNLTSAFLWSCAIVVVSFLSWILLDILVQGCSHLSLSFFTQLPKDAGREGGILSILLSTLLILLVTLVTSIPLSLATAITLSDTLGKPTPQIQLIRKSLDVLAAVPSIVFGLFGNAFFCILLGMGYSILSGGLTLACMILPILIRTSEQAIRAVPVEYRFAAESLGLSKTSILFRVILPTAAPAMLAGLILGIGRALAETAALIFTSGYVTRMPGSLLDSGRSMSIHIYDLAMNVPGGNTQAYATASVLVALLLIINITAILITRFVGIESQPFAGGLK